MIIIALSSSSFRKGYKPSSEVRAKISATIKARWAAGNGTGFKSGHVSYLTEESRVKLSAALKRQYELGQRKPPKGNPEIWKYKKKSIQCKKPKQRTMRLTVLQYIQLLKQDYRSSFAVCIQHGGYSKDCLNKVREKLCIDDDNEFMIW